MIIKRISFNNFLSEFEGTQYDENFTYKGKKALYNYIDELSDDIGNIELDIVALCTEWSEYMSLDEYNNDYSPVDSIDDIMELTTVVIIGGGSFLIQNY